MVAQRQLEFQAAHGRVLGCPLFTLGSEICHQDEQLRNLVQGIMNNLGAHVERALVEAEELGQLEKGRVKEKLRRLWSFYEGSLTRARIENNPELLRHLSADALAVIGARPALADVA
jgi:TetR/AcrR family transcriptional repressor of nem operon